MSSQDGEGRKRKKKKVIRIYEDKKGRYIKIGKKKIYLQPAKGMSEAKLVRAIIAQLMRKKKMQKKKAQKKKGKKVDTSLRQYHYREPQVTGSSSVDKIAKLAQENRIEDEINKANQKAEKVIADIKQEKEREDDIKKLVAVGLNYADVVNNNPNINKETLKERRKLIVDSRHRLGISAEEFNNLVKERNAAKEEIGEQKHIVEEIPRVEIDTEDQPPSESIDIPIEDEPPRKSAAAAATAIAEETPRKRSKKQSEESKEDKIERFGKIVNDYYEKIHSLPEDVRRKEIKKLENEYREIKSRVNSAGISTTALMKYIGRDKKTGRKIDGGGRGTPDALYDDQIDSYMRKYPQFLGTVASDEIESKIIPKIKPHSEGGFIMNLSPHNQAGTHWVAVFYDDRPNGSHTIEYYNSFGDPPSEKLLVDIKDISRKLQPKQHLQLKVNRIKQQSERSNECGFFASKFLADRFHGKRFKDTTGWSDVEKSEEAIRKVKDNAREFGYIT